MTAPFVPNDFVVPESFTGRGFHLEPLGPEHNERDHVAWMSSIDHIRATPGFPDGTWPEPMSLDKNLEDLERHARHFAERRGFTYSVLDGDDVIGCVYIYPTKQPEYDAEVTSWVTASRADMDNPLREQISAWLRTTWPFSRVLYEPISC